LFFTLRLRERISATRWSDVLGTPPDIWRCPKASPSRRQSSGVNLELIVLCQKLVATLQGQQKPLNSVSGGVADHESSADFFSVINDLNAHLCRRVYGCSPCQRSSLVAGTAFLERISAVGVLTGLQCFSRRSSLSLSRSSRLMRMRAQRQVARQRRCLAKRFGQFLDQALGSECRGRSAAKPGYIAQPQRC
jgi:hypothetical protein